MVAMGALVAGGNKGGVVVLTVVAVAGVVTTVVAVALLVVFVVTVVVTNVMVMVLVTVGVAITRLARVQMRWEWPPGHIRAGPGTGGGETGGPYSVLVSCIGHIRGNAPVGEIRQIRNLIATWDLV